MKHISVEQVVQEHLSGNVRERGLKLKMHREARRRSASYLPHSITLRQRVREEQVTVRSEDAVTFTAAAQLQLICVRTQTVESWFDPNDEVIRGAGYRDVW